MSWVDAHTHLDMDAFADDRADVVARARAAGVDGFVLAAADPADWDRVVAVADDLGAAWTLGIHPWWLPDLDDQAVRRHLDALAARPTPHGIGETGLDHARARSDEARARQERVFRDHLALARERDVPVVLHLVRAVGQGLRVIEQDGLPTAGGMVHSWSGAPELVGRAVRAGLMISLSGSATRDGKAADSAAHVPDDRLLIETDCPDQPVTPGTRGEPVHLHDVARAVAARRGTTSDAVLARTADNARRLFPLLDHGCRPTGHG